jgi:hypothetical protein
VVAGERCGEIEAGALRHDHSGWLLLDQGKRPKNCCKKCTRNSGITGNNYYPFGVLAIKQLKARGKTSIGLMLLLKTIFHIVYNFVDIILDVFGVGIPVEGASVVVAVGHVLEFALLSFGIKAKQGFGLALTFFLVYSTQV